MTNEEITKRLNGAMSKCCLLSECFEKQVDGSSCSEALIYLVEGIALDLGEILEGLEETKEVPKKTGVQNDGNDN